MKHLLSVCQLPQATLPSTFHLPQYFSFLSHPLSLNFSLKCLLDFSRNVFCLLTHSQKLRESFIVLFYLRHSLSIPLLSCSSVYLYSISIILAVDFTDAFAFHTPAVWFICFHPSFTVSLLLPLLLWLSVTESLIFLHLANILFYCLFNRISLSPFWSVFIST